ncbi:MFS-type transporter SLC18B1-like [Pollicipes pollicipes]|uniref:MFS-type transporter SLC18B1-like n=1 Tax=Pollicipes pollicipes TaxID=41117 RepID=UPI0018859690|nr:MFS-type transporter SLC18B1-like [Pollicipes pollicipes]
MPAPADPDHILTNGHSPTEQSSYRTSDLSQYAVKSSALDVVPAPDPEEVGQAPPPSEVALLEDVLVGLPPADPGAGRPEYHLLPHSVPDNSLYWPDGEADSVLPVEALFEQVSRRGSSESFPEVKVTLPPRRYRRMVSYSRTALAPLYGAEPERSSSIPVHLDQISQDPSAGGGFTTTQKKILLCIGLGELLQGCCGAVLIPFFPTDAQNRGVSESVIGLVFSSYALTQLVMTPVTGKLIPKFGMTQVLYFGLLLAGLATIGFGALDFVANDTLFIALCFVVRIISAVGASLFVTSSLTFVANQFPDNLNSAVGVVETCSAIGVSIGPAIGGGLYELGGYGLPFYVLGGVLLLCVVLNLWLMPWIVHDAESRPDMARMARVLVRSPENWLCMFALITISINWSAMEPGIQPYATSKLGITVPQMGLYFLVASGAYALISPIWGKLADIATNTYIQTSLCLVGSAVSLLVLAPSPMLKPLQPTWLLLGVGMTLNEVFTAGAFIPHFSNMLTSTIAHGLEDDVATQSFVSSVWWAVFSMGSVLGPAFSGVITEAYSFPIMMTCIAVNTLGCALLTMLQACHVGGGCCRTIRRKLVGSRSDPERQPLLDGRDRRASV